MLPGTVDLREVPTKPFLRHPWEVARARCIAELVQSWTHAGESVKVLDVGAGDGYLGSQLLGVLPQGSQVTCFDPNYTEEHLQALNGRAPAGLTFCRDCSGREFDWLLLLDVIEHVREDTVMLGSLADSRLRPGGYAIVSVPAWPALFTEHDVKLGHYRRYRPRQLEAVVARSGLERVDAGSLFTSLLVPRLVAKAREIVRGVRSVPSSGVLGVHADTEISGWRGGRPVTSAVVWVLSQDFRAARRLSRAGIRLPGLSTWTLARRPQPAP